RREVFERAGGFRDGIGRIGTRPVGCEETELCIRIQQQAPNSVLIFDPAVHVRHRVPPQRATWAYFRSRCYSEGLSKALVARYVGTGSALASERRYAFLTLARGVRRELTDTVLRRDLNALRRAAALVLGLAITTAGYTVGTLAERFTPHRRQAAAPVPGESIVD